MIKLINQHDPYIFNFPEITVDSSNVGIFNQIDKCSSEIIEAFEKSDIGETVIETLDAIHALETLLYSLCNRYGFEILDCKADVIEKNAKRGYYEHER